MYLSKSTFINHRYTFYAILVLILLRCSFSRASNIQTQDIFPQDEKGIAWVTDNLIQSGVLETPKYNFTEKFDSEKSASEDNIRGLFFEGLPYHNKPTKVFCWYGEPENISKKDKVPAVVLVHGGGGTAFNEWVKKWTDRGYIAISIALEGQLPGNKIEVEDGRKEYRTFEFSGPKRQGFFADVIEEKLENQWFYHAVADIMLATSLIKSFPNVDAKNIGITGISWGGILTNVVTGIDHRFAFSIPVYGCGYLQETPHYSRLLSKLNKEQQDFYLTHWEPSLYVPLQKQPTLFVNGTNDFHFTMNGFTKTYEASKVEKHLSVTLNMKHGHYPGWEPKTIYAFADYITENQEKPVRSTFDNVNKENELTYTYEGELVQSFLYYTTNTADWGKDNYKWQETGTKINTTNKVIKAMLPNDAVAYFINTIDPEGNLYSSPMRLVSKK